MSVIAEYSEFSGIIEINAGYQNISTYSAGALRALLDKMGDTDEIRVASIPHTDGGNALLLKPHDNNTGSWLCISPILHKSSGPIQTFVSSLFGR
jgi:hypothetical protein